jgi:hypothetical protein
MYSPEQLEQIFEEKIETSSKFNALHVRYILLSEKLSGKAQEHCQHGICRRLYVIDECLEHFFSKIPPDSKEEPSRQEKSRANIHLHAFLININGIIDNMAWLWAYNINLQDKIDLEKKKMTVGLFNKDFSKHLPESLTKLVSEYFDWQQFMVGHRHPTAHRIPPYIIPYTNSEEEDLPGTRDYTPRYIHSFSSKYGLIPLHAQSLADTNTILSLLEVLLGEIESE